MDVKVPSTCPIRAGWVVLWACAPPGPRFASISPLTRPYVEQYEFATVVDAAEAAILAL